MKIDRRGRLVIAACVGLIAAACTAGGPSVSLTGPASVAPSATLSASAPPLVQEHGAPLGPGTYTTVFRPKITFTTDASWVSYADTPDFVSFERASGAGGIGFKRIDTVLDPVRAHQLPVPKDYARWIESLPGVKVLAGPKTITVDGVAATEIDVTATTDAPTVYCKDPCVALWPLGPHADFQGEVAAISLGSVNRIVVLRLHGETVEMSANAFSGGADFKAIAKDFDTIINTVRFG